jgi:hypothetical protein
MADSDSEEHDEQQFPSHILKSQISASRGQVLSLICHNLLKLLKLFTAISITVLLFLEQDCGSPMLPLLISITFTLYSDVVLFAMVPISFNHCQQGCAMSFYSAYAILKWIIRVALVVLGICYNVFVFSPMNSCELGQSSSGSVLLAILIAIDFCLMVYCSLGTAVVCGLALTMVRSRGQ